MPERRLLEAWRGGQWQGEGERSIMWSHPHHGRDWRDQTQSRAQSQSARPDTRQCWHNIMCCSPSLASLVTGMALLSSRHWFAQYNYINYIIIATVRSDQGGWARIFGLKSKHSGEWSWCWILSPLTLNIFCNYAMQWDHYASSKIFLEIFENVPKGWSQYCNILQTRLYHWWISATNQPMRGRRTFFVRKKIFRWIFENII